MLPSLPVLDSVLLARNQSAATLKLHLTVHGVNQYRCEARNKHGVTQIVINVIVPSLLFSARPSLTGFYFEQILKSSRC